MFRFLINPAGVAQNLTMRDLSDLHPSILEALLERCWNQRIPAPPPTPPPAILPPLGHPDHRSDVPGRPDDLLDVLLNRTVNRLPPSTATTPIDVRALAAAIPASGGVRWQHLIYAYMIENTRVLDIFRRVAHAYLHGERLSVLRASSQRWLWTTEELFFRDPPSFSIGTQTSSIRPNLAATRANAYQRLFGMTLNPIDGQRPDFVVAEHANSDFVLALDELLFEIWQGRTNFANAAGARPTDDSKIAELATRLCDMFRSRRVEGTLSREEFTAVATMSWFHATLLQGDHPIILDLRADANSAEERLFKIAQRVGFPAHGLAKSYFEIAEPLSRLLIAIEQGTFNDVAAVPALYTPAAGGPSEDTDVIMTHWSLIRGRDIKTKKVQVVA
jgi:hypothetical protein